jgi:hypothetical protein
MFASLVNMSRTNLAARDAERLFFHEAFASQSVVTSRQACHHRCEIETPCELVEAGRAARSTDAPCQGPVGGGGMATAAAGAAAAAAAAERVRKEEEEMTPYTPQDLNEDWEFKILRCVTARFRDPIWLHGILQEEARAGWTMVEKFDDTRVRLKRPARARANHATLGFAPTAHGSAWTSGAIRGWSLRAFSPPSPPLWLW